MINIDWWTIILLWFSKSKNPNRKLKFTLEIINVNNNKNEIYNAINKIYNDEFLKSIPLKNSLFGEGGASLEILKILNF